MNCLLVRAAELGKHHVCVCVFISIYWFPTGPCATWSNSHRRQAARSKYSTGFYFVSTEVSMGNFFVDFFFPVGFHDIHHNNLPVIQVLVGHSSFLLWCQLFFHNSLNLSHTLSLGSVTVSPESTGTTSLNWTL